MNKTEQVNKRTENLEKEIFKKISVPKVRRHKAKCMTLGEETACSLFKAYFNNKMTVVLLHLQKRKPEPDSLTSLKAVIFFEDLYHHLLKSQYQHDYRRVFQWLRLFFKRYPYVKPVQKRKAIEFIKTVYGLFGMEFKLNI